MINLLIAQTLTPNQLQTLIIAYAAVLIFVLPTIGFVVVVGITQYKRILEAWTKADEVSKQAAINSQSLLSLHSSVASNKEEIGFIKGALNGQLSNQDGHTTREPNGNPNNPTSSEPPTN